jgi:hypothetical protein
MWERHTILLFLFGALLLPAAAAQEAAPGSVAFSGGDQYLSLTGHMQWYRPQADESLTPLKAELLFDTGAFTPIDDDWAELGIMKDVMWVGARITNDTNDRELVLEFRNPRMSRITCYTARGGGRFAEDVAGVLVPYEQRTIRHPMPAFPLAIAPGETATVLLRLENVGDFRFRAWLWNRAGFTDQVASAYYPELATIGVLAVMALFQMLVFLSLRERTYLYLCFFILAWLFFFMAGNGTGYALVWSEIPWLASRANTIFLILMCASFILFALAYLETHRYAPRVYWLSLGFIGLCVAHLAFSLVTDTLVRFTINRYIGIGTVILVGILAVSGFKDRKRLALFFLGTWFLVLFSGALMVLLSMYVLSARWLYGTPMLNFMFLFSIMMWSFELTGRVKVRAQEQRRRLEEEVRVRTRELQTALSEVKQLSGLLPICSSCKKIRDDRGYWNSVESYVAHHTDADFTHGICPECYEDLYPEYAEKRPHRDTPQPHRGESPSV